MWNIGIRCAETNNDIKYFTTKTVDGINQDFYATMYL